MFRRSWGAAVTHCDAEVGGRARGACPVADNARDQLVGWVVDAFVVALNQKYNVQTAWTRQARYRTPLAVLSDTYLETSTCKVCMLGRCTVHQQLDRQQWCVVIVRQCSGRPHIRSEQPFGASVEPEAALDSNG